MPTRRTPASGSRWSATAASILIQCTSGSAYCFALYSPLLKSSQSYDQSTLDTVATFKDLGANAGVLSGLLYSSSFPRLGGPLPVLAVGAAQCFAGYFLMWLAVVGSIPRPPVPLMCLFMLLAAHAQTFFNTADIVTAVHNFPRHRGTIVGILKGFLGLSGAILIQLYQTLFSRDTSYFLLMLAILPSSLPLILMFFVKVHHQDDREDDEQVLNVISGIAMMIAGYLMVLIILENVYSLNGVLRVLASVLLLMLLFSAPISIIVVQGFMGSEGSSASENVRLTADDDDTSTSNKEVIAPQWREDSNFLVALKAVNFWLLFLSMSCGMGSGLATVNNISQIGAALGYSGVETSTLVSLWSIWNFLGRFAAGYISDYLLRVHKYARPFLMIVTLAAMSLGHAVISSGIPGALYVGSILVGICYGSQWSLMPTITSEIFGLRQFGALFNTISIASPLGSYIFSVRIVGYIYDKEASSSGGTTTCTGTHCFMLSFLIMAVMSLLGAFSAFMLFVRTKSFYKQTVLGRL